MRPSEPTKTNRSKRRRTGSLFLVLFLAFSGTFGTSIVQGQDITLRTRVDLVVVPFSVMDDGRFVAGLEADDFTLLEDDVPQTIEEFSADPVPLSAVLLIDTGLVPESLEAVRSAREAVVKAFNTTAQHRLLGVADEVAVYRYNNRVTEMIDFTSDEGVLRDALQRLDDFTGGPGLVGGETPVDSPVVNGVPVIPTAPRPVTTDQRVLNDAVYQAALALRSRDPDRRKIILLVSDGNDRNSDVSFEDVQLRLLETEVQVFAINITTGLLNRVFGRVTSRLDDYADFTGGDVYTSGPGGLDPLFPNITAQARAQYVLTYVSTNEAPADRVVFRRIELRCREPYDIFHKAGYYQVP